MRVKPIDDSSLILLPLSICVFQRSNDLENNILFCMAIAIHSPTSRHLSFYVYLGYFAISHIGLFDIVSMP